ncbi:uncharacterized protein LOC109281530 isoform X2 [Alligator mississippiensis]|uniref:uncharacterized protein LOC109281530 isoform X2 n=1 Tax=Alligator mississippiensis TaxID=8496 RepID=UPI002877DF90|nr:uncharacterized protein LOC109281530 isoform X2 [Alligator mississippiensis]XP_059576058.1 uncharacterized protein LOC109281530 isoform X2 [Alligator mississippiensis]
MILIQLPICSLAAWRTAFGWAEWWSWLAPHTEYAAAYINDIIYSPTWTHHKQALRAVLSELRRAGLTANPRKCALAKRETKYLGFLTDASETAVGAVLTQEEKGIERPIAYASRKLTPAEKRALAFCKCLRCIPRRKAAASLNQVVSSVPPCPDFFQGRNSGCDLCKKKACLAWDRNYTQAGLRDWKQDLEHNRRMVHVDPDGKTSVPVKMTAGKVSCFHLRGLKGMRRMKQMKMKLVHQESTNKMKMVEVQIWGRGKRRKKLAFRT